MHSSVKFAPRSCSCVQCRRGKRTNAGHDVMKHDERSLRHINSAKLAQYVHANDPEAEIEIVTVPIGNYYD